MCTPGETYTYYYNQEVWNNGRSTLNCIFYAFCAKNASHNKERVKCSAISE